jgi:glycine hydroxymethyltransferase
MNLIAAMTKDRVIGDGPKIPWYISEDFKHFKRVTSGHTLIMGLTTFNSIGKPLPDRNNIVLSLEPMNIEGVDVCTSMEKAIARAKEYQASQGGEIFFIGGGSIYKQALPLVDTMYISWVKKDYAGDVYFPEFDLDEWEIIEEKDYDEFTFIKYKRTMDGSGGITMEPNMQSLEQADPEAYTAMRRELERQQQGIELIPSENLVSNAVLQAMGSVLTNKYAEGYPGKRYYGGNEFIDVVEQLAIDRAKKIFNAEHANVQPHSGSNANMAAYMAVLDDGDTVLGQKLDHGGHLTHGHPVNFSGKRYNFIQYPVGDDGLLDFETIRKLAKENKPKLIVCGFSAYSRELDFEAFKKIADDVGALLMADIAHIAGLIAAGLHPQPFPHCDIVTTTTHKTLRGPRGGMILCKEQFAKAVDKAVFPGIQGGPLEHVIAGKAVSFKEALQPSFKDYQKHIMENAKALAEALIDNNVKIVSGGTDNHLMLIDLNDTGITGKDLENALDEVGIYANKNTIPNDQGTPFSPCGLRIGTPVVTTRGMGPTEMKMIAAWIATIMKAHDDASVKQKVAAEVKELCKKFPIYQGL